MSDGPTLHDLLAAHDVPCDGCRYNLRGQTGQTCPECGRAINVDRVRGVIEARAWRERRLPGDRLVMAGLVGSLLGLGYAAGAIGTLVRVMMSELATPVRLVLEFALWPLVVAYPLLAWAYLTRTAWIERRTKHAKFAMAIAAWGIGPIDAVLVALLILLVTPRA